MRTTKTVVVNGVSQEVTVDIDPIEDAQVKKYVEAQKRLRQGYHSNGQAKKTNTGWNRIAIKRFAADHPELCKK